MCRANISQKVVRCSYAVLLPLFCTAVLLLVNACAGEAAQPVATPTISEGDALHILVSTRPQILVKGKNAVLSFLGSDAQQTISTERMSLPYTKVGNKVTIDFGETVIQNLTIRIPRESDLSVMLANGSVTTDTIQGQVVTQLGSGTIHLKNFTPRGRSMLKTQNGTIDVHFARQISCNLHAQTGFGAISSGYPTITEKRSGMQAEASGMIGNAAGTMVNLVVGYGSITVM